MTLDVPDKNLLVRETEWKISCAGGRRVELPFGEATYDCLYHDQRNSHVVRVRESARIEQDSILPRLPCRHEYRYLLPEGTKHISKTSFIRGEVKEERAMWKSLGTESPRRPIALELKRVRSRADWSEMRRARVKVESEFGGSPEEASRMVDHIQRRRRFLKGDWHLALSDETVVGEVGLLIFETRLGRLGRLQDVDILPEFQGRGLGNELLRSVESRARTLGCEALCLRADADDWPKDWYERRGFETVGGWLRIQV